MNTNDLRSFQYDGNVRDRMLKINQQHAIFQEELRHVGIASFRDLPYNIATDVNDPWYEIGNIRNTLRQAMNSNHSTSNIGFVDQNYARNERHRGTRQAQDRHKTE